MDLDKAIKERHSVRKFSSKKPDWRKILECIDASRFAPMAGNNFTLKFIVVDEEEKIRKIAEACEQGFIGTAKYVVVACSVPGRVVNAYGKNGEVFVRQQAGAAIENFLLKITESGLSACWVGYMNEDNIKEILKIPDKTQVEAVFPIGFEYEKAKRRNKVELENVIFFNKYGNEKMVKKPSIEV